MNEDFSTMSQEQLDDFVNSTDPNFKSWKLAKAEIERRESKLDGERYQQSINYSKEANRLSKVAIFIAVVALAISFLQLFCK